MAIEQYLDSSVPLTDIIDNHSNWLERSIDIVTYQRTAETNGSINRNFDRYFKQRFLKRGALRSSQVLVDASC